MAITLSNQAGVNIAILKLLNFPWVSDALPVGPEVLFRWCNSWILLASVVRKGTLVI